MLRSIDTKIRSFARPRSTSAAAAKRIMTSGPQTIARPHRDRSSAARDQLRHDAHPAAPVGGRAVHGHLDLDVEAPAPALELVADRAARPASGRRRGPRACRSARGSRAGGRSPGAGARGRSRRPRPPRRCPRPRPAATRVPNGPRTPTSCPGASLHSAEVTAPTARTVCTSGPGRVRSPLTEIGTSPTRTRRASRTGRARSPAARGACRGWRSSVHVSAVSAVRWTTRKLAGTIGPGGGAQWATWP